MAPDTLEYVATPYGAGGAGAPVYRVVDLAGQVLYVNVPYARSDATNVDQMIRHALAALARPPKPVR